MTKLRPAMTFDQAITRVIDLVGLPVASTVTDRSERAVRDWSDPDRPSYPTIDQAYALDRAYLLAGGGEAPIFQTYALRIELDAQFGGATDSLSAIVAVAAREAGEAVAALIAACQPGVAPSVRATAQRETQEAIDALTRSMSGLSIPPGGAAR